MQEIILKFDEKEYRKIYETDCAHQQSKLIEKVKTRNAYSIVLAFFTVGTFVVATYQSDFFYISGVLCMLTLVHLNKTRIIRKSTLEGINGSKIEVEISIKRFKEEKQVTYLYNDQKLQHFVGGKLTYTFYWSDINYYALQENPPLIYVNFHSPDEHMMIPLNMVISGDYDAFVEEVKIHHKYALGKD